MRMIPYHGEEPSPDYGVVDLAVAIVGCALLSCFIAVIFLAAVAGAAVQTLWTTGRAWLYGAAVTATYLLVACSVQWRFWEERRSTAESGYRCTTGGCFSFTSTSDAVAVWASLVVLALAAGLFAALCYHYSQPETKTNQ